MSKKETTYILADIGGTHLRYSILCNGEMSDPVKINIRERPNSTELFQNIVKENSLRGLVNIVIGAAGRLDSDNVWRIGNNQDWEINLSELSNLGLPIQLIVGDFEASARGVPELNETQIYTVSKGVDNKEAPKMICGPGTGIGLAYTIPLSDQTHKLVSGYGGWVVASSQTDEQHMIIDLVRRLKQQNDVVVFEDIASGRGLPYLYKAVCMLHGLEHDGLKSDQILELSNSFAGQHTLRLFHEFLGLFVGNAMLTGNARGGVYLDGGVIHALLNNQTFDKDCFLKFMRLNASDVVQKGITETPVYIVKNPFIALYGLNGILKDRGFL